MCTSPLHLHRPNLGFSFDVPCNDCLECRSASQDSWVFRLGSDLDSLYKCKGFGVFLTFTYNDKCLPHSDFGLRCDDVPCFSSDDVSRFLNKIKVYMSRTYGRDSYKYFWCSEYGKFTKRPHYHALFMLRKDVDFVAFCEKCRQYWQLGFIFPRFKNGRFVDNFGKPTTPLLHCAQHACKYVCKYITKDLDFFELSTIKKYIEVRNSLPKDIRAFFNKRLPRHFQSKGIGSSFFNSCSSPDSLLDCIERGVINPTNRRIVQLPRYYVEHFAFSHKVVNIQGNKHVIRDILDDYRTCVARLHYKVYQNKLNRLQDFLASVNLPILQRFGFNFSDLKFIKSCSHCLENVMVSRFLNDLSPKMRWYWYHLKMPFTLPSMVDFRMKLYDLDFGSFPDDFTQNHDADRFFHIFNHVFLPLRSEVQIRRENEFILQHKLRLISKGCL